MLNGWLSVSDVAKKFKMSRPLIRYYLKKPGAPVPQVMGNMLFYSEEDVMGWKPLREKLGRPPKHLANQ